MRNKKGSRTVRICTGCQKFIPKGSKIFKGYRYWRGTRYRAYWHNKKCQRIKIDTGL